MVSDEAQIVENKMYRITLALACLFVSTASPIALAGPTGGGSGDCEAARIRARAGGPTNEHDAWLLETCELVLPASCSRLLRLVERAVSTQQTH